jgi:hypothetical protein
MESTSRVQGPSAFNGHSNIPPYWKRQRASSTLSVNSNSSITRALITLEDHTEEEEHHEALWARKVIIEDYVIVKGSRTGVGAYVVWNCRVETLDVSRIDVNPTKLTRSGGSNDHSKEACKLLPVLFEANMPRYSEFDHLRQQLLQTFPKSAAALPSLPPKGLICKSKQRKPEIMPTEIAKFRPPFLEKRRQGLSFFLKLV